ncbi:MAG: DUF3343 domain-containing protein [Clostridiales bacterium]|nr:DUF3343 domain-containing protein [Clostridiales bacterium]
MYSLAVGSVTNALRGKEVLEKNGMNVKINRYSGNKKLGCGYVIIVSGEAERCKSLLNSAGIKVLDVIKK